MTDSNRDFYFYCNAKPVGGFAPRRSKIPPSLYACAFFTGIQVVFSGFLFVVKASMYSILLVLIDLLQRSLASMH
jgi:hypothetical protein